jgi:acyl-CoA synthetase (AMP-forming)/AMP-acid ligase II
VCGLSEPSARPTRVRFSTWKRGRSLQISRPNSHFRLWGLSWQTLNPQRAPGSAVILNTAKTRSAFQKSRVDAIDSAFARDGWHMTGDSGYVDEREDLFFVGRCDDIISSSSRTRRNAMPARRAPAFSPNRSIAVQSCVDAHDRWAPAGRSAWR